MLVLNVSGGAIPGLFLQRINSSACGGVVDEVTKIMEGTLMLRLCAAPFLKKALWVLRHLNNQDSAMQPSSRNISEVVAVCRSRLVSESHKRDQSIQGNTGGLLFYCGAFCSPRSAAAQSVMAFTLCITPHVFFFSTSFIIPKEPIHLISSSTLSFDLKSQAATQSGVDCGCFLRAHGSQPEAN